jgi:phage terminase small subunit
MANKLTPKQKAFADYYIKTGNATEAAIKAGYSKKTAYSIGNENLKKPEVKKYIEQRIAEKEEKLIAKQDKIVKDSNNNEYTKIEWYDDKNVTFFVKDDGVFIMVLEGSHSYLSISLPY